MLGLGMLIPGKFKIMLLLGAAVVIAGAVAYHFWKVNGLNSDLATARIDLATAVANQEKLEGAVNQLQASNDALVQQRATDQARLNTLAAEYRASQKQVGGLRKQLSEHDLGALMLDKPGLLETRVNKGTARVGEIFEELTGGGSE